MRRKLLLILIINYSLLEIGWGQAAFIRGKITDAKSNEPLIGVNIVAGVIAGTSSDLNGNYQLEIPAGKHGILFQYIGYETIRRDIDIAENETITLNINLKESAILTETVVVSAGKFEQSLGEVTVSMEVLRPSMLEGRSATSITQVMQQTPGVIIVDSEPQIRSGSGYSFGAGSRVMTLVDDLPVLSGDAGRPSWGFMPIENVTQVEVIKGASSVLYGSAALNGVINLRTAYPGLEPKTKISFFTGIYSSPGVDGAKYWEETPTTSNVSFLHSRVIERNLDFIVGGNFLTDNGHVGPRQNDLESDRGASSRRGRVNVNLRYRPPGAPGLDFGLNTNYQRGRSLGTFIWADSDSGIYAPFASDGAVGASTRTLQTVLTVDPFINYTTSKGTRQSLKGRYYKLDNDNTNEQGNFSDVFYGEYQLQQHFEPLTGWKKFTATAGIVGQHTIGEAQLFSGNHKATNFAGYLQLDKVFFDRLTASAGVRFEHFEIDDETESKTIFRSGLNFRLGNSTFLRGSFGQGYRFPTIAEKFIRTANPVPIYPTEDLESETSWNAEGGIKHQFRIKQFSGYVDAAFFYQRYDNFVEFTFGRWGTAQDPLFGLGFRSLNTGESRVRGAEISISGGGKIGDVFIQTLTGYTYTDPVSLTPGLEYSDGISYNSTSSSTEGNILKYRMKHLVRADLELNYRKVRWGISFRYNSFMKNIDQIFLDLDQGLLVTGITEWRENNDNGHYLFDLRVGYDTGRFGNIAIVANNLLNRTYTIRPLKIEKNRTITLQYNLEF